MSKTTPTGANGSSAAATTPTLPAGKRLIFSGQPISCLPVPALVGGKLPPGEHPVSWEDMEAQFGRSSVKRKLVTQGLRSFALMLRAAGGKWLFVDGSYVTARPRPSDWDGCFIDDGVSWHLVDPLVLDVQGNRTAIKAKFNCDVFVANQIEGKTGKPFRDFFQETLTGKPKGILVLDLGTVT